MRDKYNYDYSIINYTIKRKTISFRCPSPDEGDEETTLFNDFLLELSKNHNVFMHTFMLLPNISFIIDEGVVLSEAKSLLDRANVYYHLKEARVKSDCFHNAAETCIYFFDNKVKWDSFLVSSPRFDTAKLIKKGLLSACFQSVDHGCEFRFEGNKSCEERVLSLFNDLSDFGYTVKQVSRFSRR